VTPDRVAGEKEAEKLFRDGGGYWTKPEPFLMKIPPKQGIPTPFPTRGGATIVNRPVFTMVLLLF
jgi:hypothetical protein